MNKLKRSTAVRLSAAALAVWAPLVAASAVAVAAFAMLVDGAGITGFFRDASVAFVTASVLVVALVPGLVYTSAAWRRILTRTRSGV